MYISVVLRGDHGAICPPKIIDDPFNIKHGYQMTLQNQLLLIFHVLKSL